MASADEATPTTAPALDPALLRLARVIVLGSIMSLLDTTMVTVAIDRLGADFRSPVSTIQWVTTGYLLALALVIPTTGWVVDRFGSKRAWLVSVTLFLIGSLACGVAWSIPSLVVFRFLQGLGGGMIVPIGQSILARQAGPSRMGRIMSVIGVVNTLAPIMGPVIGGILLAHLSWRWIFFVNLPIGCIALFRGSRLLPIEARGTGKRIDFVGLALLSPGLASLVFGLSQLGTGGSIDRPEVVVGVTAGAVLIACFVWWSQVAEHPLLDLSLFRERQFAAANAATFLMNGGIFGVLFLLPLYYQVVRGQSPLEAGLLMAPQGLGTMVAMPISGRLIDRSSKLPLAVIGSVISIVGTVMYAFVTVGTSEVLLSVGLFLRGIGLGLAVIVFISGAYNHIPKTSVPQGTTVFSIISRIGATMWTAILAVILQKRITAYDPGASISVLASKVRGVAATEVARAFGQTFSVAIGALILMAIPSVILEMGQLRPRWRTVIKSDPVRSVDVSVTDN